MQLVDCHGWQIVVVINFQSGSQSSSSSSPTLESFLQNLLPDLSAQQNQTTSAIGGLANVIA